MDGRPITVQGDMPSDVLPGRASPAVASELLRLLRLLFALPSSTWRASIVISVNTLLSQLPAVFSEVAQSSPALALRFPQLWLLSAALTLPEAPLQDVFEIDAASIRGADEPDVITPGAKVCENHQDGRTAAKWSCDACGKLPIAAILRAASSTADEVPLDMCNDCDQFMHLSASQRGHHRVAIELPVAQVRTVLKLQSFRK